MNSYDNNGQINNYNNSYMNEPEQRKIPYVTAVLVAIKCGSLSSDGIFWLNGKVVSICMLMEHHMHRIFSKTDNGTEY